TVPSVRLSISASLDREKAGDLRVSQQTQDPENPEFGPNQWLVDALHEQWQKDPSSVDPSWAEYFASSSSTPTPDSTADEPSGPPEAASEPEPEPAPAPDRSEEHTSELQSRFDLVCRLVREIKMQGRVDVSDPPHAVGGVL